MSLIDARRKVGAVVIALALVACGATRQPVSTAPAPSPEAARMDSDADLILDSYDACKEVVEDGLPPNPKDGCPAPRTLGWGDATVEATFVPGAGACAQEWYPMGLVRSYEVGPGSGGKTASSGASKNGSYVSCDDLENGNPNLEAVQVEIETKRPISLPLEHASAELSVGNTETQSLAVLAPLTNSTDRPWLLPFASDTLSLHVDPPGARVVFVFPKVENGSRISVSGREIELLANTGDNVRQFRIKSEWEYFAPLLAREGPMPCRTDATLQRVSGGYSVTGNVERSGGQNLLFCPGARHRWLGRSEEIEGLFSSITSSRDNPLVFEVTPTGYRYVGGRGYVEFRFAPVIRFLGTETRAATEVTVPSSTLKRKVRGRLVTRNGAPQAGVEVSLVKTLGVSNGKLELELSLTRDLQALHRSTTRTDGTFEITVPPAAYAVFASERKSCPTCLFRHVEFQRSPQPSYFLIDVTPRSVTDLGEIDTQLGQLEVQ
jgi:hypothetical protein